jgi:hypothetical protein
VPLGEQQQHNNTTMTTDGAGKWRARARPTQNTIVQRIIEVLGCELDEKNEKHRENNTAATACARTFVFKKAPERFVFVIYFAF